MLLIPKWNGIVRGNCNIIEVGRWYGKNKKKHKTQKNTKYNKRKSKKGRRKTDARYFFCACMIVYAVILYDLSVWKLHFPKLETKNQEPGTLYQHITDMSNNTHTHRKKGKCVVYVCSIVFLVAHKSFNFELYCKNRRLNLMEKYYNGNGSVRQQ